MDLDSPDLATLKARQQLRSLATPKPERMTQFSVSRWPYTYACDHIRSRLPQVVDSRGDAAQYVKRMAYVAQLPKDFIYEMLATAYCIENRIDMPAF